MAPVWEKRGREFVNCNCAYGCPCQFNALPTFGFCQAVGGFQIDEGFHGKIRLDELRPITAYRSVPAVPQIIRAESSAVRLLHTGEPVKRAAVPVTASAIHALTDAGSVQMLVTRSRLDEYTPSPSQEEPL